MTREGTEAFARLLELVEARTGVRVVAHRRAESEAIVLRAMRRAGARDLERYVELLGAEAKVRSLLDDLVSELTIRESYFFRDPAHFEFVRDVVAPGVLERHGKDHVLRAWSAGCAAGEEPYSLAIALEEASVRTLIVGTDVSREAIRCAREAVYGRWALRGMDEARRERWLRRAGERWRLDAALARRVSFELHNLARDPCPLVPAGLWGMDLVFCRNVLIYFDRAEVERIAARLRDVLAPGGWLITGPSDPSLDGLASLRAVITDAGVFYRREEDVARAPAPSRPPEERAGVTPVGVARPERPRRPAEARRPSRDRLAEARAAFARGDYERARELTRDARDEASAVLHVRAVANCRKPDAALQEAERAARRWPLSVDLQFLLAMLLLDAGRPDDAVRALRRTLYLEPTAAVAHFVLASVLRARGRVDDARRAYAKARDLARARPREEVLPLGEGQLAGRLGEMAEAELVRLERAGGAA